MAKQYRKWYSFAMTYYDEIYEHAVDNYYLFTTENAHALGIPTIELAKLAQRGRLKNIARGLYRLTRYVPSENDAYAIAVALVGKDAYLFGESVIAMLGLMPTNPDRMYVATPSRVRKTLPKDIYVIHHNKPEAIEQHEGIPCQKTKEAIAACKHTVMPDRLRGAVARALEKGFLTAREAKELEEELQ